MNAEPGIGPTTLCQRLPHFIPTSCSLSVTCEPSSARGLCKTSSDLGRECDERIKNVTAAARVHREFAHRN